MALDHQAALRTLLTAGGVSPFAPWTLMRNVYETAILVHWILEPDSGAERRRRGLWRTVAEHKEIKHWQESATCKQVPVEYASSWARSRDTYDREAVALGTSYTKLASNKPNMVDLLPKLQIARFGIFKTQPELAATLWRQMSGSAHSYAYASQATSHIESQIAIPGGVELMLTVDDFHLTSMLRIVAFVLLGAMQLYVERSTRPVR